MNTPQPPMTEADTCRTYIKAWEGAIAVANESNDGRFGSHRYSTCVPIPNIAKSRFVCFHLLTPEGLADIGKASPGSADRNRTQGVKALMKIMIPIPSLEKQMWFDKLYNKVSDLKSVNEEIQKEIDAFLPSILNKAFKRELSLIMRMS